MMALIVLAFLVVLPVLALRYGVDSRDGSQDPRRQYQPVGLT
jgi:hypothetical protein